MLSFMISSPAYLKRRLRSVSPPSQSHVPKCDGEHGGNGAILYQKPFFSKKYQKIPRRNSKRKLQDMVKSKT